MIDNDGSWCYACDAPATNDCSNAMIAEELAEFEQFDIIPNTNRDYKLEEVLPNLSCSYCPPNKGENAKGINRKWFENRPIKARRTKERNDSRKLKRKQKDN